MILVLLLGKGFVFAMGGNQINEHGAALERPSCNEADSDQDDEEI